MGNLFKNIGKGPSQKFSKFSNLLGKQGGARRQSIIYSIISFWDSHNIEEYTKARPWVKMNHKQLTGFLGALKNPKYEGQLPF